MKQFIVDRHTTPSTPKLDQVPTEKIPIYDSISDAEDDLANLAVGQLVGTKDDGADELLKVVDTVEDNNMHPVTSNAVAESLSYSETEQLTGGKWIDGKPIYRSVFTATMGTGTKTITIPSNITVIGIEGVIKNSTGIVFPVPYFAISGGANYGIYIYIQGTTVSVIQLDSSQNYFNGGTINLVLEYTKTT